MTHETIYTNGYWGGAALHVYETAAYDEGKANFKPGNIAQVELDGSNGSEHVYLDRAQTQWTIDALQVILDAAGPEPVVAPECDYLRDIDGDRWVLCDDGFWGMSTHVVPREGSRNFADLLDEYGPLTPYREVTKVEAPADGVEVSLSPRGRSYDIDTTPIRPHEGARIGCDAFIDHFGEGARRCFVAIFPPAGVAHTTNTIRLTVDEAQELVNKLQANIDAANEPEPILAPENATHLIDCDGDRWDRNWELWSCSADSYLDTFYQNKTFDHVVREYGPVTTYATLPQVSAP